MRTDGMKRSLKRKRFGRAAGFLLAALLAAFLLAPGQARAANECGTISSSATTVTCSSTTYASGIIYQNAAPGANNVATVNVPGAATAWTVTSGAGTSFAGNGITLDSDGAAGGGLALTVGGTGTNVNIRQRASTANSGNDNNIGILMNQQRTGASTTTLTVHSGVTIGTSTARMNRHGIRARVWLGTGAATFTSAATIHSVLAQASTSRGEPTPTPRPPRPSPTPAPSRQETTPS